MVQLRIFGTPVKVKGTVLVPIVALWGIVTWLGFSWHPERGFWQGILIGLVTVLLLLPADFGHALAHIFSARYAGAPMDEIRLSAGMPRGIMRFPLMCIGCVPWVVPFSTCWDCS